LAPHPIFDALQLAASPVIMLSLACLMADIFGALRAMEAELRD
jgi:hypothetical protein